MTPTARERRIRGRLPLLITVAALALAAVLAVGCSSDDANPVGVGVPGGVNAADPREIVFRDLVDYGHLEIYEENLPFSKNSVLYLGRDDDDESAILAAYEFSAFDSSFWDDVDFSSANVSVSVRLFMLERFFNTDLGAVPLVKEYVVSEPAAPLDSNAWNAPADPPAILNQLASEVEAAGALIEVGLPYAAFSRWLEADRADLMIAEGNAVESEPGLVGFASRDLGTRSGRFTSEVSQLDLEDDDTILGPILKVTFVEEDTTVVIQPFFDTATLHRLAPVPETEAEGLQLRTHLRRSPYLAFDLDALPDSILVNRALLFLARDTLRSDGVLESLVLSELPTAYLDARDRVTLADLAWNADVSAGIINVEPATIDTTYESIWLGFDVTGTMQRIVNGVRTEPLSMILTGGEDFAPSFNSFGYDPDFYLSRFTFHGTAVDSLRPFLSVVYTTFSTDEGGE